MSSSQTTFRGRLIYSVGQPKQVQLTKTFIKIGQAKGSLGQPKISRGRPMFFVN